MHLNLQAKKDASSSLALVLIGVAAVLCAAFIPHVTTPRVASRLVEVNHPDACPPQWLPVLLASGSDREHSPAPQLDDQGLPFKGNDEALSMKRRMAGPGCDTATNAWRCLSSCNSAHGFKELEHSICKAKCPTVCPLPPSPPMPLPLTPQPRPDCGTAD